MTSITPVPTPIALPGEEIDLLSLLQSIRRQKRMIGVFGAVGALLAGIYLFSVAPDYQVSTLLRPAALNDLDELNRTKIYSLPPREALQRVALSLDSYDTRLSYFRSNAELQAAMIKPGWSVEQAFEKFNFKALKLTQSDPKMATGANDFIRLDLRYPQGLDGKSVLNGLVQYAIERERGAIAKDLDVMIKNRIRDLDSELAAARVNYIAGREKEIAELLEGDGLKRALLNDELQALRVQLKLRRENRMAELKEAIAIAHSLGIKRPSTPSKMAQAEAGSAGSVMTTEINNQNVPLYFLGTDALEAERGVLLRRTSDDFTEPRVAEIREELMLLENNRKVQMLKSRSNEDLFLKGMEPLRAERARLSALRTDMSHLELVNIDRAAVDPLNPLGLGKFQLVLAGAALGLFVGILVALMQFLLRRDFVHRKARLIDPSIQ
ncbi:Wzz/FepE/Etk N-terminal domain-containing protein [Pseudomonas soli]|uniref:Chain-length determining protein n=1 Tax=Pseudomonas soli TaxID=1306993 RepID=A0AAJ5MIR7_9PSED|nr:Wzz/FepE/Etk N-terminal domain-containing protein [Pseudomonas soli]UXZ44325.1 chain-length determining protein [Pseudomonas soli]